MVEKPQPLVTDPEELRRIGVLPTTFEAAYAAGTANWEIGAPQPWLIDLADRGEFSGRILDVGCGSGENALELARRGLDVTAIDCVEQAVCEAQRKALTRRLSITFRVFDALQLESLSDAWDPQPRAFDTLLDAAVFHVFSDADRARYVRGLAARLRPAGWLHLIVFSDAETRPGGPRRVSRAELTAAFAEGWRICAIQPARYRVRMFEDGARCWSAKIERVV